MTLEVGDRAPEFSLPASTGETISLSGLRGRKVVLYFYPKDDTPGCTKEACGFRDVMNDITNAGAVVLGVSADGLESHMKFIDRFELNFPLLSDEQAVVANSYGGWGGEDIIGRVVMGIRRLLSDLGIVRLPKRMTFLIDKDGRIERVWHTVRPEGHAEELLEVVKGG